MTATMTIEEAKQTIFGVLAGVAPEVDPTDVEHDVELDEQLDLDSMDYLNWLIGISKATGVEIPQRDVAAGRAAQALAAVGKGGVAVIEVDAAALRVISDKDIDVAVTVQISQGEGEAPGVVGGNAERLAAVRELTAAGRGSRSE